MRRPTREARTATVAAIIIMWAAGAFADERARHTGDSPDKPGPGTARRIVVSLPDRKLALLDGDLVVKVWATAVGTESTPSPSGTYTIVNRVPNPTYYKSGKVIPPGASNPVGTRWLGLSLKGFGIHGTNSPGSIGRKASHGCIRMRNQDVEELFELVRVGDVIELHAERSERLAEIFGPVRRPSSASGVRASEFVASASGQ
ncbi:MAG TPA: L,D-transpeptidase [Acidobacteriota bacterium]|nr:L,D-transpeptidase [Acidobacteriota bacterium]